MLVARFACPGCHAVLKMPALQAANKQVKCPRCSTAFRTPAPRVKALVPPPEPVAAVALQPAPLRPRPPAEGFVPLPVPLPLPVPVPLPLPEPARVRAAARIHRRGPALFIGLLVFGLVVLAAGAFTVYRLAFTGRDEATGGSSESKSGTSASGDTAVLNYLPADCNCVVGVQFGQLAGEPEVVKLAKRLPQHTFVVTANTYMHFHTAAEFQERFGFRYEDVEWIVAGLRMDSQHRGPGRDPEVTVVLKTKPAYDRDKILKGYDAVSTTPEKWSNGREYYPLHPRPRGPTFLHLPNEHLIVLSNVPAERRESVLGLDGKKTVLPAPLYQMANKLGRFPVWMVLPFEEMAREMPLGNVPPEWNDLIGEVKRVKLLALWVQPSGSEVRLHVGMQCADGARATSLASGLRRLWDKELKGELDRQAGKMPPALREAVQELRNTLTVETDGDLAVLSARLKFASVGRILDQAWGPGGG